MGFGGMRASRGKVIASSSNKIRRYREREENILSSKSESSKDEDEEVTLNRKRTERGENERLVDNNKTDKYR